MYFRSSWFPSKIPFTLIILPVFWVSLLLSPNLNQWKALTVLIAVHVFLYASVNGFVNYFDKEDKSVANRRVSKSVLIISILFFLSAITLTVVWVNFLLAILVLVYAVLVLLWVNFIDRRKVFPIVSIAVPAFTQGLFTLVMYYAGLNGFSIENTLKMKIVVPGVALSILIMAIHFLSKEKESKQLSVSKDRSSRRLVYISPLLLFSAQTLLIWYFNSYVSPAYNFGLTALSVISLIVLFQNYYSDSKSRISPWLNWLMIVGINAYAFFIFGDYTHVFQLLS